MNTSYGIMAVLALFFCVGALDRLFGNKLGFGIEFESGFMTLGKLALSMIGIISIAPIIGKLISPAATSLGVLISADPSIFPAMLFPCDMGGYTLAVELALTEEAGLYAGTLISSTMGNTALFMIPMAMDMLDEADHRIFACGTMCGVATIPIGCICGGLVAGFSLPLLASNTFPLLVFSAMVICGLLFLRKQSIGFFLLLGKIIRCFITIGLVLVALRALVGWEPIKGLQPLEVSLNTIGGIALALAGAYPFCAFLRKALQKPFTRFGKLIGVNDAAISGFVYTLANSIPMLSNVKHMSEKGRLLNISFAIGAAFVFGDDLAFVSGVSREMVLPMIVTKLSSGLFALLLAYFVFYKRKKALEC